MITDELLSPDRRCVLFVVDALAEPIVRQWVEDGKLPTIAKLLERGGLLNTCASIFPSITPAATCSIATGCYPSGHGIEGACWYDREKNDTAYYGDDFQLALQEGLYEYLRDFGDRLNFERLESPTIYEHLHEAGIASACINYMWFRGPCSHTRTTPWTLRLSVGPLPSTTRGPKYLKLGDFVHTLPQQVSEIEGMSSGIFGRYGFDDATTAACVLAMADADCLPPCTVAYFPLNDDRAHKVGLHAAADVCVEKFDRFLGQFVHKVGGWNTVDQQFRLLIVGDHGQVDWRHVNPTVIMLDDLLNEFSIADTGAGFHQEDQLLICPNMRSAAIYTANHAKERRERVIRKLLGDDGVDQVIYQEQRADGIELYCVRTRTRGRMSFARGDLNLPEWRTNTQDQYGNRWCIFGELTALDLTVDESGNIREGKYPNPLERIEGAFPRDSSPIWVTANPSVEFSISETASHGGGSHGSLCRADSTAALITSTGVDLGVLPAPDSPRITDVVDLCLNSLVVRQRLN